MKITCPDRIVKAIDLLEKSGYSAYAVGGCVRDSVMGREPNDWDMTSSATPDEIQRTFSGFRTVPTGIKHGTVTVIIDGKPIEITTMRVDGEYSDNRHPETVRFTKRIEDDLGRRDFTVNAMAYNPKSGIVDPYGGMNDIENRIIRCVGDADTRFNEDALRILRAVRFASTLGFDIEKNTSDSVLANRRLLENISKERIRVELIKLLCGTDVEKILLGYKELIFEIIPELAPTDGFLQHTPFHIYDVWTHTVKVVANIEPESDFRVAALLHDIEKPSMFKIDSDGIGHFKGHPQKGAETAEKILRRLRFSNAEIHRITTIIRLHDERPDGDIHHLARLCSVYGIDRADDTLKLIIADAHGKNSLVLDKEIGSVRTAQRQIDFLRKSHACLSTAELNINGNDIMALGIDRTQIRDTLQFLLENVIDEKIENKKAALSQAAVEYNRSK